MPRPDTARCYRPLLTFSRLTLPFCLDLSRPEAAACPQHDGKEENSDQSVIPPSGMMLEDACVSQEDAGWGYEPIWCDGSSLSPGGDTSEKPPRYAGCSEGGRKKNSQPPFAD